MKSSGRWNFPILVVVFSIASAHLAQGKPHMPLQIHPENSKYFLFRDKPAFLLTATEHYGSVLNRPFDFRRYLDDLVDKHMTMTRTFLLYREIASEKNPASPCKPRPEDYIAPWPRTGPAKALDGLPKFDLEKWNPEYFQRLHAFLDAASQRGILVELTLFSNSYSPEVWALNPLRAENNLQGQGHIEWPEYTSMKDPAIFAKQLAHVRKIVAETAKYDNVYYEICNEPGGGVAGHVSRADVDAWQAQIASAVREEMKKAGQAHLIFGSQAFSYTPAFAQSLDATFAGKVFDVVNIHPLPNTMLDAHRYQLGNFMSKELRLADLRHFGLAAWAHDNKPAVWDEDNAATMFTDDAGWTIHRKRAWVALLSGSHYDEIDFSIQIGTEIGTPESQARLRTWFKHLSEFFASVDFLHAAPAPAPSWIGQCPDQVLASTFTVEGKDYIAYLADQRELTDPTAGQEIRGDVQITLPPGQYRVRYFSPVEGRYSGEFTIDGGQSKSITPPPFRQDLVIRATRR
jgi:hypothetical protein